MDKQHKSSIILVKGQKNYWRKKKFHLSSLFLSLSAVFFFWDFQIDICTHNSNGVYKSDALNLILLLEYCFSQPHHGIKSVVILYCSHNLTLHIKCISILFPKHLVILRNIFLAIFCYWYITNLYSCDAHIYFLLDLGLMPKNHNITSILALLRNIF